MRRDEVVTNYPLHALSQYQGESYSAEVIKFLEPDFLGTGLIVDDFRVVGTVRVYNKNWNSSGKTEVSSVAYVFKTRLRRPSGLNMRGAGANLLLGQLDRGVSWDIGAHGVTLALMSGASNRP